MLNRCLSVLVTGIFLILISMAAEARTNIDFDVSITSAPPAPPEDVVMMPPEGYSNCYMTQGVWFGNVWVPPHQECSYPGPSSGSVWVSGYWGCVAIGPGGNCGHWKWYSHRWVRGPQMRYNYGYNHSFHHRHW